MDDIRIRLPEHLTEISVGGNVYTADRENCIWVPAVLVPECQRHGCGPAPQTKPSEPQVVRRKRRVEGEESA